MPDLNPQQFKQQHLFDPGPKVDSTDYWHGGRLGAGPLDPSRKEPLHMGTAQAAIDRVARKGDASVQAPMTRMRITGPMENDPDFVTHDEEAQDLSPYASRGLYYKNVVEDPESVSAVVPNMDHVQVLDELKYTPRSKDLSPSKQRRGLQSSGPRQLQLPGTEAPYGGLDFSALRRKYDDAWTEPSAVPPAPDPWNQRRRLG